MENPILISNLNDFIFCPVSIYFHNLYDDVDRVLFQGPDQLNGTDAHKTLDGGTYSTRKDILQGYAVYSDQYNLIGKIDQFDIRKGELIERKRKITHVYDGYIFQLYGQYFCLMEMGYEVKKMSLYSLIDNKKYPVKLPEKDQEMVEKFCKLLLDMTTFDASNYIQENVQKCQRCIYEPMCSASIRMPVV